MNRYNDSEYQDEFTCPDCGATEKELDKSGHKLNCPNAEKAKLILQSLFGDYLPIK